MVSILQSIGAYNAGIVVTSIPTLHADAELACAWKKLPASARQSTFTMHMIPAHD